MKRGLIILISLCMLLPLISAECLLDATLVSQNPHTAVPGENVKLIFQLDGIASSDCEDITFKVNDDFPFTLDQSSPRVRSVHSGTYIQDYASYWTLPYEINVDKDAIDGDNNLSISYSSRQGTFVKTFPINIDNPLAEFEIRILSYSEETKELSVSLLNVGETDVDALTLELFPSEGINFYGKNSEIVGSIESTEDEIIKFNADINEETLQFKILYNDNNNFRREQLIEVSFDKKSLTREVKSNGSGFSWTAFLIGIILSALLFFSYRYFLKKKDKKKLLREKRGYSHIGSFKDDSSRK